MPELPDVEVFRRYVNATSLHQNIESVEVRNEKILGGVSARKLQRTLKGHTFESTRRHGKNLFVELDGGGWMLVHFGMTGSLAYFKGPDEEAPSQPSALGGRRINRTKFGTRRNDLRFAR